MAAKVIAFINFKGGVGKTSNVVNLGACLAKHHGRRVLIVDLDAQCNSTFWLLRPSQWERLQGERVRSVVQIFLDHSVGTCLFDFEASVIRGLPWSEGGFPHIPTLDLLPATVELLEAEERLHRQSLVPFFRALRDRLNPYRQTYDYILLDCPPNVYGITKNALFFADHYVVPYVPDYLSLSGLKIFTKLVGHFQDQVGAFHGGKLGPRLAGVIVNRYKKVGKVFDQALAELELTLNDLRAQNFIHAKARVFAPPVRDCVSLAECTNVHLPVIIHKEDALSSLDYDRLTEVFLRHFENTLA